MIKYSYNKVIVITAICLAVILLAFVFYKLTANNSANDQQNNEESVEIDSQWRHPLSGQAITEDQFNFFPIAVMIDNAYDLDYQAGLNQAHIVYESLVEGTITRLLAIFDSNVDLDKIGPVRSARNYFMDWAEEYTGVYMHVGGSPQALSVIDSYDFVNIDQIGAGEIYFWRDDRLTAPHNVFTSTSNILRIGELKEVPAIDRDFVAWNFVAPVDEVENLSDILIDFSNDYYQVDWKFNTALEYYQRWQNDTKQVSHTGEQLRADNIIIQVVDSHLIDEERLGIDTQAGGEVVIYNKFGKQIGNWRFQDGRTLFFDQQGDQLKLVPGTTWVEIVDSLAKLSELAE
jgi:hypothetical protein